MSELKISEETAVIILGASSWPKSDGRWKSHEGFYHSAYDFKDYILSEKGLSLDSNNLLFLFNDKRSASEIDEDIDKFLVEISMKESSVVKNIVFYYVGHGAFTEGDQKYCLAVYSTRINALGQSGYRVSSLARTLNKNAKNARRFIIIDACFAAAGHGDFIPQSDVATRMENQTMNAMAESGTALLCASSAVDVAMAPKSSKHTMFTGALLKVLKTKNNFSRKIITFDELATAISIEISRLYKDLGVRPEVHVPDQRRGDLSSFPLFPTWDAVDNSSNGKLGETESEDTTKDIEIGIGRKILFGTAMLFLAVGFSLYADIQSGEILWEPGDAFGIGVCIAGIVSFIIGWTIQGAGILKVRGVIAPTIFLLFCHVWLTFTALWISFTYNSSMLTVLMAIAAIIFSVVVDKSKAKFEKLSLLKKISIPILFVLVFIFLRPLSLVFSGICLLTIIIYMRSTIRNFKDGDVYKIIYTNCFGLMMIGFFGVLFSGGSVVGSIESKEFYYGVIISLFFFIASYSLVLYSLSLKSSYISAFFIFFIALSIIDESIFGYGTEREAYIVGSIIIAIGFSVCILDGRKQKFK